MSDRRSASTSPGPSPKTRRPIARLTYSKAEAAEALGVSIDYLERHVQPELRVIREGRLVLIPVRELDAWAECHAARTLKLA